MTLRNVPKAHTLEQQRQEINLIASDLDTAVDGTKTFGGSKTFSSDVTFSSTVDFDGDATFADNVVANFGDDADLKIFYDGRVGYVTSYIESDQMIIRPKTTPSDTYIDMLEGGPVRLYYGSSTRLSTGNTGVSIAGNLDVSGNLDSTDITCNSIISNAGGTPTFSIFNTGNALFEDVEATSIHMKDDRPAHFGTNEDASLYYDNTSSDLRLDSEVGFHVRWYDSANTQYEDQVVFSPFGGTSVYYQGAANPTVDVTNEVRIRGDVEIGDISNGSNLELHAGNNNKLKIFASGNEAYIRNIDNNGGVGGGGLNIAARTTLGLYSGGTGGQYITFVGDSNGAANLYHQTLKKLETTADGVEITGGLKVDGILESSLLVNTNNTPTAGEGIEMFYDSAASGGAAGGIQAYDRDGAALTRLKIKSSNWEIENDGSATFAGDLTLSDDTKEVTAQKIRPITTGSGSIMTIGGSNLGALSVEADVAVFDQIGFMAFSSAGLNLGAFGTGALSTGNATGTNGIFKKYEEGTFTPALSFGGSDLNTVYASREGHYTRIGNAVFVSIVLATSTKSTATGTATVSGLPFASSNTNLKGYAALATADVANITYTGMFNVRVANNATSATLIHNNGNALTDTAFASNSQMIITGCYFTD